MAALLQRLAFAGGYYNASFDDLLWTAFRRELRSFREYCGEGQLAYSKPTLGKGQVWDTYHISLELHQPVRPRDAGLERGGTKVRIVVGILCLAMWLLYVGQAISAVDFGLAQRLGLQEKPDTADPLYSRLELWTARWDLLWLWTLPAAGILMVLDHAWWPYAALIGGGAFVDAGGREAAKVLGAREQGVRTGSAAEYRLGMTVFATLVVIGGLAIVTGLIEAT